MEQTSTSTPRLVVSDFAFAPADRQRLATVLGASALLVVEGHQALREALGAHRETDVVCSFRPPSDVLQFAPNLRWLAQPSAGIEHLVELGLVRVGGPVVTTATGIHAVPIGEFVLGLMLQWARHWPTMYALRRERAWPDHAGWEALRGRELAGATLGVIGLGAIGRQVARFGRALGMRVLAVRQSARPGDHDSDADELLGPDQLGRLLGAAEYVVIAVPSTPATHHLIGAAQLAQMRPTAFLINIARGALVDEAALIAALRAGQLAGAGLDVFAEEPLPPESPLWGMPNVVLSPHLAGATDRYSQRFTDLFIENIGRWRAGQPLRNQVDPTRGY
ncbi:MAG TPA: D-2-hydroxyacid dehydrogenase [Ktedonobacterales bacterium]